MLFGFGFNKQKTLSAAEKYVQQGKIQNAISEYEKVLKNDPKDLTVTNTVGDLYSRLGDAEKATECFKTVGDAYATQGFTVKAIAMYKKISKLKPSLESMLKLAELYTQQGLFNDARAQYLQVAEEFLKGSDFDSAVRIFQKILEMDPENANMRIRLAEVYVRLGKKNDAWQILSATVETLRSKGALSAAEEVLQRMLKLDPGSSYALLIQGRNLLESGDAEAAIAVLQKVSDLDSNPDGLRDLLKAYLKTGRLSDAGTLAGKLLSVHNDLGSISTFIDALMQAGQYENALQVYEQHAERLLAEDSEKVLKNLHSVIGHVRDNSACLEKLLDLFQKAGETTHITEVIELLAHASVQSGNLPRARDLYHRLATMEPGNPLHMSNYQQVVSQIGGGSGAGLITAEEAAVIVDELEATSPAVHQHYSDVVALAVRSALTDAELFISYNMPAKALDPLMTVLPQAPSDLRLNQRLAALHTRASRFAEAAVCCRTLQNVYSEAGYAEEATRYGELAARYEERAAAAAMPAPAARAAVAAGAEAGSASPRPTAKPQPAEETELAIVSAAGDSQNEVARSDANASAEAAATPAEIDLSSEWDDALTIEADASPAEAAEIEIIDGGDDASVLAADESKLGPDTVDAGTASIEEIRFYLEHGMPEQAASALEKLPPSSVDEPTRNALRAEIEAALHPGFAVTAEPVPAAEAVSEPAVEEISAEPTLQAVEPIFQESAPAEIHAESAAVESSAAEPAAEAPPANLQEFVADLESSLKDGFLAETPAHEAAPAEESAPVESVANVQPVQAQSDLVPAADSAAPEAVQPLGDFVADLEASLGDDFLKGSATAASKSADRAASEAHGEIASTPAHDATSTPAMTPEVSPPFAARAAAASAGASAISSQMVPLPQSQVADVYGAEAAASSPVAEAGIDLAEMFGDLKQDLEAGSDAAQEDPETHYNLGIAFREMGLLDEAIGELQKTCQAVDHGHRFSQTMQTYTWLAQCFLDKGVPQAAIRWYDKALTAPGVDEDARTALHYELAAAYETAGDKPSALKHFMEVYGRNIDYRDVAERIKPLKS